MEVSVLRHFRFRVWTKIEGTKLHLHLRRAVDRRENASDNTPTFHIYDLYLPWLFERQNKNRNNSN